MRWAHDTEVAVVDGGDGVDAKSFSDSDDRRIDEAEIEIGVAVDELGSSLIVRRGEVIDAGVTAGEPGEERGFGGGSDPTVEQPAHLDDHGGGNDDRAAVMIEPVIAGLVVGVVAVSDRDEGARVDDDGGHEPNSARRIVL